MQETFDIVKQALSLMQEDAENKRELAGQAGRQDDGGYRMVMSKIECFNDGIDYAKNGEVPEWQNYLRLKEKFEKKMRAVGRLVMHRTLNPSR